MGELQEAVATLLQAFSHGLSIIKTQRSRRKKTKTSIDPTRKAAEADLSRSLRKNRADVKKAYDRESSTLGPGFAAGDEESRFSLSTILLRLNAGFVSLIERFTRGKSTPADYQTLVNLSNASRVEAIRTFESLSNRLSHSSLALVPSERHRRRRKSKKTSASVGGLKSHAKSKSAPELAVTPLGVGTKEAWVRPKNGRKLSSDSRSSLTSSKRNRTHPPTPLTPQSSNTPKSLPTSSKPPEVRPGPPLRARTSPPPVLQNRAVNRRSIMSFASDSTKLGEIPEHKWATPVMFQGENVQFPVTTFYPIEPYQEPKQRSRFMRLFSRSRD